MSQPLLRFAVHLVISVLSGWAGNPVRVMSHTSTRVTGSGYGSNTRSTFKRYSATPPVGCPDKHGYPVAVYGGVAGR